MKPEYGTDGMGYFVNEPDDFSPKLDSLYDDHIKWVMSLKNGDIVWCKYRILNDVSPTGVTSFIAADLGHTCQSGCRVWVKDCDVLLDSTLIKPLPLTGSSNDA